MELALMVSNGVVNQAAKQSELLEKSALLTDAIINLDDICLDYVAGGQGVISSN